MWFAEKLPFDPGDLDRRQKLGIGLSVFLLSGFLWAGLINFSGLNLNQCTLAGCRCEKWDINESNPPEKITEEHTEPVTGDIECNSCSGQRFFYHIGVFWIGQEVEATQMYVCKNGEKTGEYYRTDGYGEIQTGNILPLLTD